MARPRDSALTAALAAAGGAGAPPEQVARLRDLLTDALRDGARELTQTRSGYAQPVTVAFAPGVGVLLAVAPLDPAVRADPDAAGERAFLVAAALAGALVEAAGPSAPAGASELALEAGRLGEFLVLAYPAPGDLSDAAEFAALAFEEQIAGVDRLRAVAHAVPAAVLGATEDLRPPIGEAHPLRVAEVVARLGGRPADPAAVAELEDATLAVLDPAGATSRPHEDADPARRVARRILQRLAGMGKWGGYHTEFAHLARGFAGHERALALEVGERLLGAGLLLEKPSVGQRHVFLNPRRAREIYALRDTGALPDGLDLR